MSQAFVIFVGVILSAQSAFGFDYEMRTRRGMKLSLHANEPLTQQTSRLLICSDNKKLRIRHLTLVSSSYENLQAPSTTVAYTNKGCFLLGNIKFAKTGLWEINIWDQDGHLFTIPALVHSKNFALYDELKRPAVQVWVPRVAPSKKGESWLFCGKKLVNDVFLYHPATGKKVFRKHLSDFSDQCRIFSKLPLPEKGEWQLITILDNGDKVVGKVIYH